MTPEQMAEFAETVATATASAVAEALNKEPEVPEVPEVPEAQPVENSIEIEFEEDIGNRRSRWVKIRDVSQSLSVQFLVIDAVRCVYPARSRGAYHR